MFEASNQAPAVKAPSIPICGGRSVKSILLIRYLAAMALTYFTSKAILGEAAVTQVTV